MAGTTGKVRRAVAAHSPVHLLDATRVVSSVLLADNEADAAASGTATAAAVGVATIGSPASAAGTSTVLASSATLTPSAGASVGTATAQADGLDAAAGSDASASGTAQAAAVGGATAGSVASASGVAIVAGVTDAPPVVESGSGGRARFRPSRRFSRVVLWIELPAPTVLVRGWSSAPVHASLALRWPTPLVAVTGRSVPAFRVAVRATIGLIPTVAVQVRTEPPTFDLSDDVFLFIANQFFNG
jgi:hypothetical protein